MDKIIVGFDPGTTVGIAILSLDGRILKVFSQKNVEKGQIIELILRFGNPVLIATDKANPPKAVLDLASEFGCKVFSPKEDIRIEQKNNLVNEFKVSVEDEHQLDALAAAVKAWKAYRKKPHELEKQEIVTKKIEKIEEKSSIDERLKNALLKKERMIGYLLEQNKKLSKRINVLNKELSSYRKIKLTFDKLIEKSEKLSKLEKYLRMLKEIEKIKDKNLVPVIVLEMINERALEELNEYIGLEGRVVFSNDSQNFSLLNSYQIECLLTEKDANEDELSFPVAKIQKEDLENFENVAAIKKELFQQITSQARKRRLIKWLEEYKKRES